MAIAFCAAPFWEPLWKGLIEGGVLGFNLITLNGREKNNYLTQQFILVFYLLATYNIPKMIVPCFLPRLPLILSPLHTPLHRGRLFLVGCCVQNDQSAAI
jgi:hypothetical protein